MILALPVATFGLKYLYANLALASGIHVIVMRQPEITDINHGWDPKIDNQDLQGSQNDETTIDSHQFHQVMIKAIDLLEHHRSDSIPSFFVYPNLYFS